MIATQNEITLASIDDLAKSYSKSRETLSRRIDELEAEVAASRRRHIGGIKVAAANAAGIGDELRAAIAAAPHLFDKPKTFTLHGITVGFRKGTGRIEWDDSDKVCALIRKHLPDQADVLIITTEAPSSDALKNLDTRDLARIGVRIEGTSDSVLVKSATDAVDKLVAKILKESTRVAA